MIAILSLVGMIGLLFVANWLSSLQLGNERNARTTAALAQAREALISYALQYREQQIKQGQFDRVYGYLPLPDLGTTHNNNTGCTLEGCDAANFSGNALNTTAIGRLPWRTLGTEPFHDSSGECLWYMVSGSHQRELRAAPMNWDSPSHLDVVVANGSAALASALASAHDRPVAVIFSPGPPLPGQDRSPSASDSVTRCGGNYDARNYLDPAAAGALGGVTDFLSGTNNASAVTNSTTPKALSLGGKVYGSGGNLLPGGCQAADCTLAANDAGLSLSGDDLFGAIRKNAYFRTDINALLDRMVFCLRDKIAASSFVAAPITGYTPPADKSAGRIADDACYDVSQDPRGYYDHYKELAFVAKPNSGNFTVNGDSCAGALLFAGQRRAGQRRISATDKNTPDNYLETANLASFKFPGTAFSGSAQLDRLPASDTQDDVARCIPVGPSFTPVTSPALAAAGFSQLVVYDPVTRTLTLGHQDVTTGSGAAASALFGCAWLADVRTLGSALRVYFRFQFKKVGTSVGSNGFVLAVADALANGFQVCGAAGSQLGYSGNNGSTPKIAYPKIGIEFDQGRNSGAIENADPTASGRNDPCGTSSCGGSVGYNSHAAIVYWGHEAANATDGVTQPDFDDNVHGLPSAGSLPGALRPPPANPGAAPGVQFVNMRGNPDDSNVFHVRAELNEAPFLALGKARAAAGTNINLLSPGSAIGGISLSSGDRVLVNAQASTADNGVYVWKGAATPMVRATDADTGAKITTASVAISEGTYAGSTWQQVWSVASIGSDAQDWQPFVRRFRVEIWIEGDAAQTDKIAAMKITTRPMSMLYPNYDTTRTLDNTASFFAVAGPACGPGNSCPSGQVCGNGGLCYRPALQSIQLGFTGSQRTSDQEVTINDFFATWQP